MEQDFKEETILRKYLLGEITEEEEAAAEITRLEERLMTDDQLFEHLEMLEDMLCDDYLDGTLSGEERTRFERHFLAAPERRKKLRFIRNLRHVIKQNNLTEKKPFRPFRLIRNYRSLFATPWLKAAAAVLLVLASGFIAWRVFFFSSDAERGAAELRAAYRSSRPFESRLTGFDYAPFSETRGGEDEKRENIEDATRRDRAARILLDAARDEPGAQSLHALGRYYLTEKQFDKAVAQFEAALRLNPNDAQLHSDYGAALVELAKTLPASGTAADDNNPGKRLENLARGFEHISRALELNNSLPDARFNKALVLQEMRLPEQAKQAWREYLEKDANSGWAAEARRNLQELEEQKSSAKTPDEVLADFFAVYERRDETRAWEIISQTKEVISGVMIFFQLTRGFLEADANRDEEKAGKYLAALNYVGELERRKTGDPYFAEIARFYAVSDAPKRKLLLDAQNSVKTGFNLCLKSKYAQAILEFTRAKELFLRAENMLEAELIAYWLGFCNSSIGKINDSVSQLSKLEESNRKAHHKWLLAQTLPVLSANYYYNNESSKAIAYYKDALKMSVEAADIYNQQRVLAQQAHQYASVKDSRRALTTLQRANALQNAYFPNSRQTWRKLMYGARVLYDARLHHSAVAFGQEAQQIGTDIFQTPDARHYGYLYLAILYGGLQKYTQALDYAEKSMQAAQTVENDASRQVLVNFAILRKAHLHRQAGDCNEAIKKYDDLIPSYAGESLAGYKVWNYDAQKGRLLCYFALDERARIEQELPAVIELFEKNRSQILEERSRNTFFDNEQSIYDLAIKYAQTNGDQRRAFEYSENSKARSLLDSLSNKATIEDKDGEFNVKFTGDATRPLSFDDLQMRIPEQAQLVQYAVLPDKLLIWVITKTQISLVEKSVTSAEINEKVSSYLNQISRNKEPEKMREQSRSLYENLINPILPLLDRQKEICFIPDKSLYYLPFASLVSPQSEKFLIEDFVISLAPSASVFVISSESASQKVLWQQQKGRREEKLLSVGNPFFDRQKHAELPDLPGAAAEAKEIALFYPNSSKILINSDADKKTLLSEIDEADVFHFAGHYVVDEQSPLHSTLLLTHKKSETTADDDDLAVHEISRQKLGAVRLAVLSACRTGIEGYYNGEGMVGVARTFLARGVPLVVASQWSVDSEATAQLMIQFHRYRKQERLSTSAALRRAQLAMLNDSNPRFNSPYFWAAFLPIGGRAAY